MYYTQVQHTSKVYRYQVGIQCCQISYLLYQHDHNLGYHNVSIWAFNYDEEGEAYRFKSLHVFFRHQTCNDYNYGHRNIAQLSDALIKMHKYLYICMYILIRRLHIFHKLDLFLISWLLYVSIFLTTTRTYILNSKFQTPNYKNSTKMVRHHYFLS